MKIAMLAWPRRFGVIVGLLYIGVNAAKCQSFKPPFEITANIVWSNSVSLPSNQKTNVSFHFKFKNKSPDAVREIVQRCQGKKVSIVCDGAMVAQGTSTGVLVDTKNDPVGLVLVFETREEAKKAKTCLTSRTED